MRGHLGLILFFCFTSGSLLFAQSKKLAPTAAIEYDKYGKKIIKLPPYAKKLDRKTFITPYLGVGIFPSAQQQTFNKFGRPENVYAGFTPSFHGGIGMYYIIWKERLSVGANLGLLYATKPNYRMIAGELQLGGRYSFFADKYKLSPFVFGGISAFVINLDQKPHTKDLTSENGSLFQFGENATYTNIYEPMNITYGPVSGLNVGGGLEYKIDRKYKVFIQAAYMPTFGYNNTLQKNIQENNSFLNVTEIQAGVAIRLMKPKPPEIDTNTIFIPDLIAQVDVPDDNERGRMLVRENVFDVILREGLKHDVRVNNNGHEIIIDEEVQDPCKVTCYLFNDKGDMVSSATSTAEGKVVFSDLDKGIYDISFVLDKPCTSANFKYSIPDPGNEILLQHNNEGNPSDSMSYNIEGRIDLPDTTAFDFIYKPSDLFLGDGKAEKNKNFDVEVILCKDGDRIMKHYIPGHDERFSFKGLPPAKYDVIFKVPDAELHTGVDYMVFDSFKHPLESKKTNSDCDSLLQTREEHLKYKLKGKIEFPDSTVKAEDVTLFLVNCFKKIVSSKKPEADGTFVFNNLHTQEGYSVFYELDDPMKRINLLYRVERPTAPVPDVKVKVIMVDMMVWQTNTEYDMKGNVINPKGYAVQVTASDNIDRINYLCKNLMEDGFKPISIQVQGTANLNKRFAFSKDFKLFKILIGEYATEKEAIMQKYKLDFYGYDAYVVKHL
ncbi:MAG: hypothetical protein SFY32_06745 [Bacteroidota bacterium]|nr:hypothetical protein [Bacteroidota bacterium]